MIFDLSSCALRCTLCDFVHRLFLSGSNACFSHAHVQSAMISCRACGIKTLRETINKTSKTNETLQIRNPKSPPPRAVRRAESIYVLNWKQRQTTELAGVRGGGASSSRRSKQHWTGIHRRTCRMAVGWDFNYVVYRLAVSLIGICNSLVY